MSDTKAEVLEKIIAAHNELGRVCKNGGRVRMSIPMRPDDSDIVIAEGLRAALHHITSQETAVGAA